MLEINSMPSEEPDLRVGIILPEDDQKTIELTSPDSMQYKLLSQEQVIKESRGDSFTFQLEGKKISVNNTEEQINSAEWKLTPEKPEYELTEESGVKVNKVISGRSFHWKKHIEVFLPGKIEIQIVDNSLMLVNELPLEQYIMCIATSEMSSECPLPLIESQTIAARSWMLANVEDKHRELGLDVCNDDCCQRYQGTTHLSEQSRQGALNTYGKVLMYDNEICDARYSKNCGGVVESFENVWQGEPLPYIEPKIDAEDKEDFANYPLNNEQKVEEWIKSEPETFCSPRVIPDRELEKYLGSVDEEGSYFRWKFEYTQEELNNLLNKKLDIESKAIVDIIPCERGYSGRLIKLKIEYRKDGASKHKIVQGEYEIRRCFHESFLYSSAFIVEIAAGENFPKRFILEGAGWGHGVGLCQIGAVGMALKGYATEEILNHYFPNSKLNKIY